MRLGFMHDCTRSNGAAIVKQLVGVSYSYVFDDVKLEQLPWHLRIEDIFLLVVPCGFI
jgi:hypothetical protein